MTWEDLPLFAWRIVGISSHIEMSYITPFF